MDRSDRRSHDNLYRSADPQSGFTLTELIVTIGIIMVLAAITVPALSAFRRGQRLDNAARITQTTLNHARSQAITKHARQVVVFYQFNEGTADSPRIRHAIAVYSDPVGDEGDKGYFEGGYVGSPQLLPDGIRFAQGLMQVPVWDSQTPGKPSEPLPLSSDYFRKRNPDAIAFLSDGSLQERDDISIVDPSAPGGANIYLPEEGYYEVPSQARADIMLIETTTDGSEILKKGISRRALVDVVPMTGRANSGVFDATTDFATMGTP